MNKKILVLSLLCLIFSQCNLDSDVLASFKGGTVTRKELREFFKLNTGGRKLEPGHPTVEEQTQLLETLGLFKLIGQYNTEKHIVNEQEAQVFLKYSKPQMAASFLQKALAEKSETEGQLKFAFARVILVTSKDPSEAGNALAEKRAEEILQKVQGLSSKKEIANFITENTDETSRRAIGGLLEPQCLNCGPDPNSEITLEAAEKKGTWILKELKDPQDPRNPAAANVAKLKKFLIIRVEKQETIYAGRLGKFFARELGKFKSIAQDYIKTPGLSEQSVMDGKKQYADMKVDEMAPRYEDYMKKRFIYNVVFEQENRLIKEAGFERANITQENIQSFNDESVLLKNLKTNEVIKYKDVVSELKEFAIASGLDSNKLGDKANILQFFKQQYVWYKISSQSEEIQKALTNPDFADEYSILQLYILQPLVFKKVIPANVDVSEAEMREHYETGKLFTYAKPNPANPQDRIPLPYGEVRERIKEELLRTKKQGLVRDFTQKLKADYQLLLETKSLKVGKV